MNLHYYFDHAATSLPKPDVVQQAVLEYFQYDIGSPGRGSHAWTQKANKIVTRARQELSKFFGHSNPERVIFGSSGTDVLNLVLNGVLTAGDHVIISNAEHNAVIRPLQRLTENGITYSRANLFSKTGVDLTNLESAVQPNTKLVVVTGGSNVLGHILPLAALRKYVPDNILLGIDAAQIAGSIPIQFDAWGLDFLATPGHKGLHGLPGTGILLASDRLELKPFREGGTGFRSSDTKTPAIWPDGFEAGSLNLPGIMALKAAVEYLNKHDINANQLRLRKLNAAIIETLKKNPKIQVLTEADPIDILPLTVFKINDQDPGATASCLSQEFGIATRSGLHCAPDAHKIVGSQSTGLVRISLGPDHTEADVQYLLNAIEKIAST